MTIEERIECAIGARPISLTRLSGGCVGDVRCATFASREPVVVKTGARNLDIEGAMLRLLHERSELPVPGVLHAEPTLLVIEHIENDGTITSRASEQEHAASLLASLHSIAPQAPNEARFGLEFDTLIGGLAQPNGWMASWVEFFAERRLVHTANEAHRAGMLDRDTRARVERFARDRLSSLIAEPARPSLLHGDAWGGNILVRGGRVAAFIDPAVYHGHAEAELAFGTLFGTFTEHFFGAYRERRMIAEGFFDVRRDVYNLYPLLVHARLFGGGYVAQIDATLRRFGG
jgi:fructosamine-3-kinase